MSLWYLSLKGEISSWERRPLVNEGLELLWRGCNTFKIMGKVSEDALPDLSINQKS